MVEATRFAGLQNEGSGRKNLEQAESFLRDALKNGLSVEADLRVTRLLNKSKNAETRRDPFQEHCLNELRYRSGTDPWRRVIDVLSTGDPSCHAVKEVVAIKANKDR